MGAEASHPSIAATGRIAFARLSVNTGLWMLPLDRATGRATGEPQRVGRESASRNYPNLSADGKKLVYVSNRGGNQDVWIRNLESGEDRQLTASASDEFRASISPDGKMVAYTVNRDVVTIPAAGGVEKVVCRGCSPTVVMWSPDGSKLLGYWGTPIRHGTIDVATGRKEDLIVHPTGDVHNGRFSPDGRWLTLTLVTEGNRSVYITSIGNGAKPENWIRIQGEGMPQSSFWSADGNLLYIHMPGGLWAVKLDAVTKMPVGERFLVRQLGGPSFVPLFSPNGNSAQELYFMALETSANIWIADPVSR